MENVLFPWASLQPTATVAYWAEAQLASPRRRPLDGPCRWCTSALGVACSPALRRSSSDDMVFTSAIRMDLATSHNT
jgi:hypothetical protein